MRATTTMVVARLNLFYSAVCKDGAYKCTLKFGAKILLFFQIRKLFCTFFEIFFFISRNLGDLDV